jgi:hypothetical protein
MIHDTYLRRATQQRDGAVPPLLEVWAPGADLLHDDVVKQRYREGGNLTQHYQYTRECEVFRWGEEGACSLVVQLQIHLPLALGLVHHAVLQYQAVCFKEDCFAHASVGEENAEKYRVDEQIDENLHHDIEPPEGPGVLERRLEEHRCVVVYRIDRRRYSKYVFIQYMVYKCVYYCMLYVYILTCVVLLDDDYIHGMAYGIWHMAYKRHMCCMQIWKYVQKTIT